MLALADRVPRLRPTDNLVPLPLLLEEDGKENDEEDTNGEDDTGASGSSLDAGVAVKRSTPDI